MPTEEDIQAATAFRNAMDEAGLALISTAALKEIVGYFTDEVSCPYCAEWNTVKVSREEETCFATCVGCGKEFQSSLVEYLTAEATA